MSDDPCSTCGAMDCAHLVRVLAEQESADDA